MGSYDPGFLRAALAGYEAEKAQIERSLGTGGDGASAGVRSTSFEDSVRWKRLA